MLQKLLEAKARAENYDDFYYYGAKEQPKNEFYDKIKNKGLPYFEKTTKNYANNEYKEAERFVLFFPKR